MQLRHLGLTCQLGLCLFCFISSIPEQQFITGHPPGRPIAVMLFTFRSIKIVAVSVLLTEECRDV